MDHNDLDATDEAGDFVFDLEQIPGVDSPTTEALIALDYAPPMTAEDVVASNGRLIWNHNVCSVLSEFPQIGVAGSAANRRFADLFRVLGGRLENLRPVAELVMIYPPRETSAVESDG